MRIPSCGRHHDSFGRLNTEWRDEMCICECGVGEDAVEEVELHLRATNSQGSSSRTTSWSVGEQVCESMRGAQEQSRRCSYGLLSSRQIDLNTTVSSAAQIANLQAKAACED